VADQKDKFNTYAWIKFWTESWLNSTARQSLSPAERSVWADLLCLAKRKNGYIEIVNRTKLARALLISRKLLDKTLQKLIVLGSISPNSGSTTEVFYVIKWELYQAEKEKKS
jgi:hypothetical protein